MYASVRLVDSDLHHENGVGLFEHFVCITFGFVVDWFGATVISTITHKSDAMVRTPHHTCSGSVSGCAAYISSTAGTILIISVNACRFNSRMYFLQQIFLISPSHRHHSHYFGVLLF